MIENVLKNDGNSHFRCNDLALHWYQENWHVFPVGRPMLEEVYCGKSLKEALQAMGQSNKACTRTGGILRHLTVNKRTRR